MTILQPNLHLADFFSAKIWRNCYLHHWGCWYVEGEHWYFLFLTFTTQTLIRLTLCFSTQPSSPKPCLPALHLRTSPLLFYPWLSSVCSACSFGCSFWLFLSSAFISLPHLSMALSFRLNSALGQKLFPFLMHLLFTNSGHSDTAPALLTRQWRCHTSWKNHQNIRGFTVLRYRWGGFGDGSRPRLRAGTYVEMQSHVSAPLTHLIQFFCIMRNARSTIVYMNYDHILWFCYWPMPSLISLFYDCFFT